MAKQMKVKKLKNLKTLDSKPGKGLTSTSSLRGSCWGCRSSSRWLFVDLCACRCVHGLQGVSQQRRRNPQTASKGKNRICFIDYLSEQFDNGVVVVIVCVCVYRQIYIEFVCFPGRPTEETLSSPECNSSTLLSRTDAELHDSAGMNGWFLSSSFYMYVTDS